MNKTPFILFAIFLLYSCDQLNEEEKTTDTSVVSKIKVVKGENLSTKQNHDPELQRYQTTRQQADLLILYYKKAHAGESIKKYERFFFEAFPSTFEGMQDVFGYDDSKGAAPLYDYPLGDDVIKLFTTLTTIPKDKYYQKYINICVGGKWEADNIRDAFGFADKLLLDTKPVCFLLEKYSDEEIKSVFRFIFDGPHPNNEKNQKLYNKLLPKVTQQEERLGKLLTAAYADLMNEDDGHGH